MAKPTKQGRPKKYDDRKDLPTETSGYYIKRDEPGVVDNVTSWWNETDPNYQYIGIGNPKERVAEHERNGTYDPERDHIEVIPMKDDATYDELRTWEQEKIAEHSPVKNKTPGGEGRTPGQFRNCQFNVYANVYHDDDDEDEDDDDWYDDDEDDDDDDDDECVYCTNLAAVACPNGCCASCCSGCDRHGW